MSDITWIMKPSEEVYDEVIVGPGRSCNGIVVNCLLFKP